LLKSTCPDSTSIGTGGTRLISETRTVGPFTTTSTLSNTDIVTLLARFASLRRIVSISTEKTANGYRWRCSCGQVGNEYGTEDYARMIGEAHLKYMHP